MGPVRPDGGWGWVIAAGALLIGVIVDGVKYSFGILFIELLDTFRGSKSDTSWIISIQVGLSYFTGPLVGALVNRFGCRKVAIVGTLLSFAGFVISPFASSLPYLYVSFGVLGGLGFGMMMLPFCVTVVRYFDKYLAFATGISAMGPGLGTIIFNPLTKALIDKYTWRGTLLIEAGLVFNGLVCAALLRQPEEHKVVREKSSQALLGDNEKQNGLEANVDGQNDGDVGYDAVIENNLVKNGHLADRLVELHEYQCRGSQNNLNTTSDTKSPTTKAETRGDSAHRWITWSPLQNPSYLLLMLSTVLIELSLIVPFSYIPDMMTIRGYTRPQAVWIISIIGISSTISRVIAGAMADLKCVNRVVFCIICIIATGVTSCFFPLCQNYVSFVVLGVAFGISAGSSCSLRGILIPELFGVDIIADYIGISMFFSGAAAFISLPIAGAITDVSGSYTPSFLVAGIEMVVGGVLIAFILCLRKRTTRKEVM